ncbi:PstS family phosphate ABC transporter substrate-binding protein [Salinisphaera aquimarina]|uniref:PstS family phosphate ABC transporter substrate-binding protein n=1 Tax=Salinisphaera aquimarina TaxID=2094031 RepID=A0ABV7ENI2_9GAMM
MPTFSYTARLICTAAAALLLAGCGHRQDTGDHEYSRAQMRIVGSSTVYPFSSYVAEELGATTDLRTPVVEATGSGGGFKLFCAGVAEDTPDVTNASRPMKPSELAMCRGNGVEDVSQIMLGFDGIVIGQKAGIPAMDLTREQLTLAVADRVPRDGQLVSNPYKKWSDIDASLPDRDILIYGPPTSSGTRDAFEELVVDYGAEHIDGYDGQAPTIRQDGKYVPSGENDNLVVQKLAQNPNAVGIFGYSFLEENRDKIQAARIDGIKPERALISSGEYPISRSLFFYVKNAHVGRVPGMDEYVQLFLSDPMASPRGALKTLGLISLPADELEAMRQNWQQRKPVTKDSLENPSGKG